MRPTLLAVLVLALLGAAAPQVRATASEPARAAKSPQPTLGISHRPSGGAVLAWFDPVTLRALPGRKVALGSSPATWAFSADRAFVGIASCSGEGHPTRIRFVNARAMRVLGDLRLSPYAGCTSALVWLRSDRLLAVVAAAGVSELVVVDPVARKVVRRVLLPSGTRKAGRTATELVLLLASDGRFAPARVAVVDAEGAVRTTTVDRVLEGEEVDQASADHRARMVVPGLAVDPDGRRAFLVPHSGPVAEIDLSTLGVTYHELDKQSLLGRVGSWLFPSAHAKVIEGPQRDARWLGDGMIAVSGMDYSIARSQDGGEVFTGAPAGVRLVDTRSWTSRVLDGRASGLVVAPGLVIAQGGRWDSVQERGSGPGVVAFGLDGRERWRLHSGEYRWMDTAGPVGYLFAAEGVAEVVELATGSVLATLGPAAAHQSWPQLLAEQESGW